MSDTPVGSSEVRRIAGAGLRGDDEPVRVDVGRWPIVLSGIDFHRLTGIALASWERGGLELASDQVEELAAHHRSAMVLALTIERQLLSLVGAFREAGVRVVVIKGPAVAHGVYPDPSMRPFGDLDLLVSAADWRRACEVLRSNGYRRDLPEPRKGFDERFGKAATHSDSSGFQVDLHRTLVLGPFGLWLDPDELLRHTEEFELAGRRLERLDRTGLLVNAALHAGLGASPPLLLPLRDVVQAAAHPAVDWARLQDWASRWRLALALAHAFENAERQMDVELPAPARAIIAMPPGRAERSALRAYGERRRTGGMALAAVRAIPGVRPKTVYVLGLLLPSREFLQARARGRTRASYLSRWRVPVGWMGRRRRRTIEMETTVMRTNDDR
jgi:hypothetical protein